jgi:3-phosphoshikimate 1-carboxyvinyltransferase
VRGSIRPPGSKSITNRALVCAALAQGSSTLAGALDSDDTRLMVRAWQTLGVPIRSEEGGQVLHVEGRGGSIPAATADLDVGNSGTTVRFLAAVLTLGSGTYRLSGTPRMHERPMSDLLAALGELGASAASEQRTGCPPIIIQAAGLKGGMCAVRGDVSSQFLSGLLLAAPYAQTPVTTAVVGKLVSQPYVDMTLGVMKAFGVVVDASLPLVFRVPRGAYQGRDYSIEPDASAASYFLAAAAVTGGRVAIRGLGRTSLQGDVRFADLLERMGCRVEWEPDQVTLTGGPLNAIDADMSDVSDTAQTLAAAALFAQGTTRIRGIGHIRHKETDRIAALAAELTRVGATVAIQPDGLDITPGPLRGAVFHTYDDHRMAMSLALVGLSVPGVEILDPGCTAKTYPGYFDDLFRLCTGGD